MQLNTVAGGRRVQNSIMCGETANRLKLRRAAQIELFEDPTLAEPRRMSFGQSP